MLGLRVVNLRLLRGRKDRIKRRARRVLISRVSMMTMFSRCSGRKKSMEDLRVHCQQFSSVSIYLVVEGLLEPYILGAWFLERFSDAIRSRLIGR